MVNRTYYNGYKIDLEIQKFGKRAEITPQLYSQGMKHFVTRLTDKCWFSKKPHINELTVQEAIIKYPNYMLWCRLNLRVRWAFKTREVLDKLCFEDNKNHPLVIAYLEKQEKEYEEQELLWS